MNEVFLTGIIIGKISFKFIIKSKKYISCKIYNSNVRQAENYIESL